MPRLKTVLLHSTAFSNPLLGMRLPGEVPEVEVRPIWYREDGYDFGSFRNERVGRYAYRTTPKGDRDDYYHDYI